MAFPNNPNDQDQTTVNGILYEYSSARNSWDKIPYATRNGASAYNIAVTNGFVGTEQQWLDSLVVAGGTIDDLSDVDTTTAAPTDGQALVWDNANSIWVPGNAGVSDYNNLTNKPTIPANIDDLTDVDTTTAAPTDGQALVWDNANSLWKPGTIITVSTTAPSSPSVGDLWVDTN